jgi:hypothetical protein
MAAVARKEEACVSERKTVKSITISQIHDNAGLKILYITLYMK